MAFFALPTTEMPVYNVGDTEYPPVNVVDTFGTIYAPRVMGDGLSALELGSAGEVAFTLSNQHSISMSRDSNVDVVRIAAAQYGDVLEMRAVDTQIKVGDDRDVVMSMSNSDFLAFSAAAGAYGVELESGVGDVTVDSASNIVLASGQTGGLSVYSGATEMLATAVDWDETEPMRNHVTAPAFKSSAVDGFKSSQLTKTALYIGGYPGESSSLSNDGAGVFMAGDASGAYALDYPDRYARCIRYVSGEGMDALGQLATYSNEPYWEVHGGALRLTHTQSATGSKIGYSFRVNNRDEMELVRVRESGDSPSEFDVVAKFGRTDSLPSVSAGLDAAASRLYPRITGAEADPEPFAVGLVVDSATQEATHLHMYGNFNRFWINFDNNTFDVDALFGAAEGVDAFEAPTPAGYLYFEAFYPDSAKTIFAEPGDLSFKFPYRENYLSGSHEITYAQWRPYQANAAVTAGEIVQALDTTRAKGLLRFQFRYTWAAEDGSVVSRYFPVSALRNGRRANGEYQVAAPFAAQLGVTDRVLEESRQLSISTDVRRAVFDTVPRILAYVERVPLHSLYYGAATDAIMYSFPVSEYLMLNSEQLNAFTIFRQVPDAADYPGTQAMFHLQIVFRGEETAGEVRWFNLSRPVFSPNDVFNRTNAGSTNYSGLPVVLYIRYPTYVDYAEGVTTTVVSEAAFETYFADAYNSDGWQTPGDNPAELKLANTAQRRAWCLSYLNSLAKVESVTTDSLSFSTPVQLFTQ